MGLSFFNKRRVLTLWLISYFVVILCVTTATVAVYLYSFSMLTEQVAKSESITLKNIKNILDNKLQEIEVVSAGLSVEADIRRIVKSKNPFEGSDTFWSMKKTLEKFARAEISNPYIDEIFVYAGESDIMLSLAGGLSDSSVSPFPYEAKFGMSKEEFLNVCNNKKVRGYMLLPKNQLEEQQIILFAPIFPYSRTHEGMLVITVNMDLIKKLMENTIELSNLNFLVVDDNQKVLCLYNKNKDAPTPTFEMLQQFSLEKNGTGKVDQSVIVSMSSQYAQWQYAVVVDTQDYTHSLRQFRNFSISAIIIFSAIGVTIALFWSRHNYFPIKKMMKKVSSIQNNGKNEMQMLSDTFEHLFEENGELSELLRQQRSTVCQTLWGQLLRGRIVSEQEAECALKQQGISLHGNQFAVMLIRVDSFGIFSMRTAEYASRVDFAEEYTFIAVQNIMEELLGDNPKGYVVAKDAQFVCVINYGGNDLAQERTRVLEAAQELRHALKQHFKIETTIALSNNGQTLYSLSQCYDEAFEFMEFASIHQKKEIVQSIDLYEAPMSDERRGSYSLSRRRMLIGFLLAHDFGAARNIIQELAALESPKITGGQAFLIQKYCYLFDYMVTMETIDSTLQPEMWNETRSSIAVLLSVKNEEEYVQSSLKILDNLQKLADHSRVEHKKGRVDDILSYIEENLSDANLSVTSIAENTNYCAAHIFRLLQEEKNMGTQEYIQTRRIELAKKLLEETDMSVEEISRKVGYLNFRTMNAAFKKTVGTTGAKYREQMLKIKYM